MGCVNCEYNRKTPPPLPRRLDLSHPWFGALLSHAGVGVSGPRTPSVAVCPHPREGSGCHVVLRGDMHSPKWYEKTGNKTKFYKTLGLFLISAIVYSSYIKTLGEGGLVSSVDFMIKSNFKPKLNLFEQY
jgi:hypothetical protein